MTRTASFSSRYIPDNLLLALHHDTALYDVVVVTVLAVTATRAPTLLGHIEWLWASLFRPPPQSYPTRPDLLFGVYRTPPQSLAVVLPRPSPRIPLFLLLRPCGPQVLQGEVHESVAAEQDQLAVDFIAALTLVDAAANGGKVGCVREIVLTDTDQRFFHVHCAALAQNVLNAHIWGPT